MLPRHTRSPPERTPFNYTAGSNEMKRVVHGAKVVGLSAPVMYIPLSPSISSPAFLFRPPTCLSTYYFSSLLHPH
ncbi:hypothetical protein GYMLUDRAFT_48788 [Collybiopsis luxurians FD-317 M1]|uniref:Uncharacterized protein n=1 Tax=Collybiopsis luxurians FD-317 M1 TaxID=944289 RepID=A0A0D0C900_9AGAR|nr:hypothetical protein GYMLUDRAFT_48788 [Collybiopsis luxurians FD-317 M1]